MDDVVVGAIELTLERALERLDLRPQVGLGRGHAEHADRALALHVRLLALTHDQQIDRVERRQRTDHVAELNSGTPRPRDRAESRQQDAGHATSIPRSVSSVLALNKITGCDNPIP